MHEQTRDLTEAEKARSLDKALHRARIADAERSEVEGRAMRTPGGGKLVARVEARRRNGMPRIKE